MIPKELLEMKRDENGKFNDVEELRNLVHDLYNEACFLYANSTVYFLDDPETRTNTLDQLSYIHDGVCPGKQDQTEEKKGGTEWSSLQDALRNTPHNHPGLS